MVGATEATRYPVVAPDGIVKTIDVLLHELIVTGALFNVTKLPFCETPKPDPLIAT
jgi:hypothetical protein